MSERFVFEMKVGKDKAHKVIFPLGRGRRELRALGGTLVGYAILNQRGLRVEFVQSAPQKLLEAAGF